MGNNLGSVSNNNNPGPLTDTGQPPNCPNPPPPTCGCPKPPQSDGPTPTHGTPPFQPTPDIYADQPGFGDAMASAAARSMNAPRAPSSGSVSIDSNLYQTSSVYGQNHVAGRQILKVVNGALDLRWHHNRGFDSDNASKLGGYNPAGEAATFGYLYWSIVPLGGTIPNANHYSGWGGISRSGPTNPDPRDPDTYASNGSSRFHVYDASYYWYSGSATFSPSYVSKVSRRSGSALYYTYDSKNRLQSISGDTGRLTPYFGYDDSAPTYYTTRMFLQDSAGLDHRTTYYYYDASSQFKSMVEPENVVTYYTLAGTSTTRAATKEVDPDGVTSYFVYDAAQTSLLRMMQGQRPTYYSLDTTHQFAVAATAGVLIGDPVHVLKTDIGGVAHAYEARNISKGGAVSTNDYTGTGLLTGATDPNGNRTAYQLNARNLRNIVNYADGGSTYYAYAPNTIDIIRQVDPRGQATYFGYLADTGLRAQILDPLRQAAYFGYDAKGNRTRALDARGGASYWNYDSSGDAVSTLDAMGNPTYFAYNGNRQPVRMQDALLRVTYYTVDKMDQRLSLLDAAGAQTAWGYNNRGLRIQESRPGGRSTYFAYDSYKNPTVTARTAASGMATTYYQYDVQDNLIATTDPNLNVSQNGYNTGKNLIRSMDALNGVTYFIYDPRGNVEQKIDANGNSTVNGYDARNRLARSVRGANVIPPPRASNVVARFRLDEASGTRFDDSGHGYFLYDKNSNVGSAAGVVSNAAVFTGASQVLMLPNNTGFVTPSGDMTVAAWVRRTVTFMICTIAAKSEAGKLSFRFLIDDGSNLTFNISVSGTSWSLNLSRQLTIDTTKWHHYAATYQPSTGFISLYVDGIMLASQNSGFGPSAISDTGATYFTVGAESAVTPANVMWGSIDELYVYNILLDQVSMSRLASQRFPTSFAAYPADVIPTYFGYDVDSNKTVSVDPRGNSAYFGYDLLNRQVQTLDALSNAAYFGYDANNNRTAMLNARGYAAYFGYDALSRNTAALDAAGRPTYFGYDVLGNRTAALYPGGGSEYFGYDAVDRNVAKVDRGGFAAYYGYDLVGNRTQVQDPRSNAAYYGYDLLDRQVASLDAAGRQAYYQYDPVGNRTALADHFVGASSAATYFGYNGVNRLIRQSDALNRPTYYQYDAVGNRTVALMPGTPAHASYFQYDKFDRQAASLNAVQSATYYAYDAASNRIQVLNPRNNAAYYAYDGLNRVSQSLDALSGAVYFVYDSMGNVVRRRDVRGFWTYFTYDALNRVTQTTDPNNGTSQRGYDAASNLSSLTPPAGSASYFAYDKRNLSVATLDGAGDVAYFGYDAAGNKTAVLSPRGYATYFAYDPLNRLSQLKDAVGGAAYFGYDIGGNTSQALDALSRPTYFAYDKLDRVTAVMDALNNSVYFGYDSVGNRAIEQDARLNTTYYQYDAADRLAAILDPLQKAAYFGYDANSNLAVTQDNIGAATYFGYDALDRRTVIGYSNASQYFAYDAGGNLTQILDAWGSSYFGYDSLNRVIARSTPRADAAYYAYDAASNLLALQYPQDNKACYYAYDGAQRMTKLLTPYGNAAYWNYDPSNDVPKKTYGNGMVSYASFDAMNRMTSLRYVTGAGAAVTYFDYARDVSGRITKIARETDLAVYYSYDNVDRVLAETWRKKSNNAQIYAFTYNYDATGNRLKSRRETTAGTDYESTYYSYAADNSLTKKQIQNSALSTYYYYDANGSLSTSVEGSNATYFTYAGNGLIASITPPASDGNAWNFSYDGQLNRYKIDKGGGVVSNLLWDGLNMMEERDGAGALVGRYTYGYSPVASIGNCVEVYLASTAKTYVIAMDHRGTGHVLLDNTGAEVGRRYYDAYGVLLGQTGTWPIALGYQTNWQTVQIGSKWWGLSAARVYDFATGQFTSRDPLPNLTKLIGVGKGNSYGIFSRTVLGFAIWRENRKLRFKANRYYKWYMNVYRAWSNSPPGQIDDTGFNTIDMMQEITAEHPEILNELNEFAQSISEALPYLGAAALSIGLSISNTAAGQGDPYGAQAFATGAGVGGPDMIKDHPWAQASTPSATAPTTAPTTAQAAQMSQAQIQDEIKEINNANRESVKEIAKKLCVIYCIGKFRIQTDAYRVANNCDQFVYGYGKDLQTCQEYAKKTQVSACQPFYGHFQPFRP